MKSPGEALLIVDAVDDINSALTVLMNATEWADVDMARRAITSQAVALLAVAEKIA